MTSRRHEPSWWWPSGLLRGYLVGGSIALAFAFLVYTQSVVNRLERQGLALVRLFKTVLETEAEDTTVTPVSRLEPLFGEIRSALESGLPVVVTDPEDTVLFAAGLPAALGSTLSDQPEAVRRAVWRMGKARHRIALRVEPDEEIVGYLHWGEHRVIRELRWIPPLEVAIAGLFVLLALLGLRHLKAVEQRSLWYGMAREAAHQMGTPISSLMGWLELIRSRDPDAGEAALDIDQVAAEMSRDVQRLSKIARRFERIGHPPRLEVMDVQPILEETATYFRARIPHRESTVQICEEYGQLRPVRANRDLLTWVMENLVRNSLEAMEGAGRVTLRAEWEPGAAEVRIQVEDTGRGMTGRVRSRLFRPGFSTKKRGWGLGLAMAKRIIEEGHGGKLRVVSSQPGRGTIMEITLPAYERGLGE